MNTKQKGKILEITIKLSKWGRKDSWMHAKAELHGKTKPLNVFGPGIIPNK